MSIVYSCRHRRHRDSGRWEAARLSGGRPTDNAPLARRIAIALFP